MKDKVWCQDREEDDSIKPLKKPDSLSASQGHFKRATGSVSFQCFQMIKTFLTSTTQKLLQYN